MRTPSSPALARAIPFLIRRIGMTTSRSIIAPSTTA